MRRKMTDNIFERLHSLNPPGPFDARPIVISENPSRDFVFPVSADDVLDRLRELPAEDVAGLTHLWLRRVIQTRSNAVCRLRNSYVVAVFERSFCIRGDRTFGFGSERSARRTLCFAATANGPRTLLGSMAVGGFNGNPSRSVRSRWTRFSCSRLAITSTGTGIGGPTRTGPRPRTEQTATRFDGHPTRRCDSTDRRLQRNSRARRHHRGRCFRRQPSGWKKTRKNRFGRYTVGVRNDEVATHPLCHNLTIWRGGAGGNRTPVHQAMSARATTIPEVWPNGSHLPGQLTLRSPPRLSSKPADFPAVSGLSHRHRLLLVPGCS
jgi:hypothetical protein